MANSGQFQLFNLATMSGVFPGTRTMVFQRLRLQPSVQPLDAPPATRWARLLWYDDPAASVLELDPVVGAVLRIPGSRSADLSQRLVDALQVAGWTMRTCAVCTFFLPLTAASPDNLPTGQCTWRAANPLPTPQALATQSLLALDCAHWQLRAGGSQSAGDERQTSAPISPMRKRAEQETNERWTWWGRLRRRFLPQTISLAAPQSWEEKVVERSGTGAGTEPCFACQGRIANLGALAVATPEGDKRTFSVWRCRTCYTYYLNDWTDRWERTDNLETEERYYRLAPAEALEVLAVINGVVDAEHPAHRHERDAQRAWMVRFIGARSPLSHQIKQGR